ncbi:MAG: hypothetical protein QF745_04885, partial [Planctomycetota bacterium]|nr:hypothetical protein [Planctomycetota bacterium]
ACTPHSITDLVMYAIQFLGYLLVLWSLFLKREEGEWGEGVECKRVRGWWGLGRNGDFLKESAPHERILSLS